MFVFSPNSAIGRLLLLRTIAIVVQLLMVLAGSFVFYKDLNLFPVLLVIAVESAFQLVSVYAYRNTYEAAHTGMLLQLLADVIFLTIILSLSGGASNAFVSLLLLPIVIGAVTLPKHFVIVIAVSAIASYGYLFWQMPSEHVHHMNMTQHFAGMLVNFVFSVLVIVFVVMALAKQLQQREIKLAKAREKQLKNEQLLALGAAAAQATHQLATPIATLGLLLEEVQEEHPQHPAWQDIQVALTQCKEQLEGFRAQTEYLKHTPSQAPLKIGDLLSELKSLAAMQFSSQSIILEVSNQQDLICADPLLIPALLNVVANAARANEQTSQTKIEIKSCSQNHVWILTISDLGSGIEPHKLVKLGHDIVPSEHGLGMALVLSNATLERLQGKMTIENNPQCGATTTIMLPLMKITI
ncbi:HAMP domain-containing histidine kinase [Pseudoalteromonas sp. JBTF-M23]|uniref:histidine kinase n=1 Tax=Pseudoalteromonas caenipelagi TaxID=2726988 RepID=A0A849VA10_9GAMM|nr:HAMP domain-containing sensor histidine kinase [Pseudoalteromonas caenipelagi]NOU50096.1 HAMP domain-containing histidine kinase [Pseudoalteromonas caenipelagi]